MSPSEEKAVIDGVRDLRTALLGDLDGSTEGAIHKINRIHQDFYHPENPREAVHSRIKKLEDTENKRTGFLAALSFAGGVLGFAITSSIAWLAGKK